MTSIKQLTSLFNKTELIGLLSVLIALWGILYIIPDMFFSLFNTILGNFILLLATILIGSKNYAYGILTGAVFVIMYRFSHMKEGFEWTQESTDAFIKLNSSVHPNTVFDTIEIKKQANQEELDYYLENGMWPWSQEVQNLYKKAVMTNPFVRSDPQDSVNKARTIYNQSIILEMLSWQTKEGRFLTNGVSVGDKLEDLPSGWGDYGYSSGLITKMNNVIRCGTDASGNVAMQQTKYTGKDGITGAQTHETTPVDYNDLDALIPGFSFIRDKCNPCIALNGPPDYSCPFNLDISGNRHGVSAVWQYLWGVNTDPLKSYSSAIPENVNPEEFPILSELKSELNTLLHI